MSSQWAIVNITDEREIMDMIIINTENKADIGRYIKTHVKKLWPFFRRMIFCLDGGSISKFLTKLQEDYMSKYPNASEKTYHEKMRKKLKKYLSNISDELVANEFYAYSSRVDTTIQKMKNIEYITL